MEEAAAVAAVGAVDAVVTDDKQVKGHASKGNQVKYSCQNMTPQNPPFANITG